jgi:tetratricopeptide (TPR) repeat protein
MSQRVTVAMIVRDEADMAPGFLAAARGLWDELVVVDTGSRDETPRLFEASGARVLRSTWHDDFSLARNEALEAATGDWVLVLDADERVSPQFIIDFLKAIESPALGALALCLSNALPYGHRRESFVLRAWRNDPAVRFRYPIHEDASASVSQMLLRTGTVLGRVEAPIEHLGYVRSRAAAKDKKARDLKLLTRCVEDEPFDFYSRLKMLELARYWQDGALWHELAGQAADALEQAGPGSLAGSVWGGELVALVAEGLFANNSAQGLEYLRRWEPSLVPHPAFIHRLAVTLEALGDLHGASEAFRRGMHLETPAGDAQLTGARPRLGLARLALARQAPIAALAYAKEALSLAPRDPEALVAVATLVRSMEGAAGLDAWETEHLAAYPSCPERDWAIGEALYALGDYRGSASRLKVAAGVPPAGPAGVRLAQALLADGHLESARSTCQAVFPGEAEAGLGVLLFELLDGKSSSLELELTPETADAAMRHWVDALLASRNLGWKQQLARHASAVTDLFPWLPGYLTRRAG